MDFGSSTMDFGSCILDLGFWVCYISELGFCILRPVGRALVNWLAPSP